MRAFAGRLISCSFSYDDDAGLGLTVAAKVDATNYLTYYQVNGGSWGLATIGQWVNDPNAWGWHLLVDHNGLTGDYKTGWGRPGCFVPWGN